MNEPPAALRRLLLPILPYELVSLLGEYTAFIGELVDTFPGHVGSITHVLGLSDDWIVIGGKQGLVLYQLYTDRIIPLIQDQHITALLKLPDPQKFAVGYGTQFEVWDGMIRLNVIDTSPVYDLLLVEDAIVARSHNRLQEYHFKNKNWTLVGAINRELPGPLAFINSGQLVFFSHARANVFIVGPDDHQYIGYVNGGVETRDQLDQNRIEHNGHFNIVTSLALLLDGRFASGSMDSTVRIWSGPEDSLILHTESPVKSLSTFPDGKLIVGLENGLVQVWM